MARAPGDDLGSGIDASTMEANAAMRSIVRREDGAGWQAMLGELARSSGIATPSVDQLRQFGRTRPSKRVSNAEWVSPADPEARIARMKDGRTRLAYNANARGDLQAAASNLEPFDLAPSPEAPAEVVAEKGYHGREVIKRLDDGP